MGWRGAMRSLGAAARAAERDAQRRHKAALKEQMIADAANAVSDWEAYIDDLLSIHTNLADEIDWASLADTPPPVKPVRRTERADKARAKLQAFRPSLLTKVLGGTEKSRQQLESAIATEAAKDERSYKSDCDAYDLALQDWEADTEIARRLNAGDEVAIIEVIEEYQVLNEEARLGRSINFAVSDGQVLATVLVHADDIVPSFRRKQLASGKLSESKMPVGQFNELYQDYVCSVALKVAGDLFRILPQREVYVTCEAELLDTATGHQKPTPILSVQFVQDTFMRLNLRQIDPSDSMQNFNHVMRFTKTKGFSPVEPLIETKPS